MQYLFLAFKEIPVETLVEQNIKEHKFQRPHMTKNTSFTTLIQKMAWKTNDIKHKTKTNPEEWEDSDFKLTHFNTENVQFSMENYEARKEIRKYSPFTEEINRKCL